MTKYKVDVWYGWTGGKCPVNGLTIVEVFLSDGGWDCSEAEVFDWSGGRVVAYLVKKEAPREFWIDPVQGLISEVKAPNAIHVREVI